MTNPQFTISLIRELRGSPLTVLVAILLLEHSGQVPVTAQLLKDVTGYKDHTITDSLRALESPTRQLVTRVTGGWRLTDGFQLPLSIQNRDIRGFDPSSSSSSSSRFEESNDPLLPPPDENREYRDSYQVSAKSKAARQACKVACTTMGIHNPAADQISALVWTTPEYIHDHVAEVLRCGQVIGLAIWRIKNQWDAPIDKSDGRRYATGEYADQIEH